MSPPPPPKKIQNVYLPPEYIRAGERLMAERATWTDGQRVTFAEQHARPAEDRAYWRGWRDCFITALIGLIAGTLLAAILMSI